MLKYRNIGISISDSPDLAVLGLGDVHQADTIIEFIRHLLLNDARLIYGHDLREGGYAQLFTDLLAQYGAVKADDYRCVNYLAWPIAQALSNTDFLELRELGIEVKKGDVPKEEVKKKTAPNLENCSVHELRSYWSKSLTDMRTEMTKNTEARIFVGGATEFGKGSIPGLYEEALMAIKSRQPIYFIGSLGGASKIMIDFINGQELAAKAIGSEPDQEFRDCYRKLYGTAPLNTAKALNEIGELGINGLSELNGLSPQENQRLFETPYTLEMVRLVLSGLKRILVQSG